MAVSDALDHVRVVPVLLAACAAACDSTPQAAHIRVYSPVSQLVVGSDAPFFIERIHGSEVTPACIEAFLTGPGELGEGGRRRRFVGTNGVWALSLTGMAPGVVRVYASVLEPIECGVDAGAGDLGERSAVPPLQVTVVTQLVSVGVDGANGTMGTELDASDADDSATIGGEDAFAGGDDASDDVQDEERSRDE